MKTLDEVLVAARAVGFPALDAIGRLALPAVALRAEAGADTPPLGTRVGGRPALPDSMPWPRNEGRSLAFIAQIDLTSLPVREFDLGLPDQGLLSFFYDVERGSWGFDPADAGSFAVRFVPEAEQATVAAEWPDDLPSEARFASNRLASEITYTLPAWDSVAVEDLRLDARQLEAYQNLLERVSGEDAWATRGLIGGHPDPVQGEMTLECAMVAAGVYCGDAKAYEDPRLAEFRREARAWRHLLQVPSWEEAGMMWGDMGCLYYWIHEDDLKARRFERSWMILQCG